MKLLLISLILLSPSLATAGYFKQWENGEETYIWDVEDFPIQICLDNTFTPLQKALFHKATVDLSNEYTAHTAPRYPYELEHGLLPSQLFHIMKEPCTGESRKRVNVSHTALNQKGSMSGTTHMRIKTENRVLGYVYFNPMDLFYGNIRLGLECIDFRISNKENWNYSFNNEYINRSRPMYISVIKHELLHILGLPHLKNSAILTSKLSETSCYTEYCESGFPEWFIFTMFYLD